MARYNSLCMTDNTSHSRLDGCWEMSSRRDLSSLQSFHCLSLKGTAGRAWFLELLLYVGHCASYFPCWFCCILTASQGKACHLHLLFYKWGNWLLVQDGGVEGHVLVSSCESSKIATSCVTTIYRRTLEPTAKRYPMSKDEEAAKRR